MPDAMDPSSSVAPPEKAADRSPASGTTGDLQTVAKSALGRIPKTKRTKGKGHKTCPECGWPFQGNGWDGIDAHWRAKHEDIMPYREAWPLIKDGSYPTQSQLAKADKIAADTARYEALAREHGADLSEEGFKEVLKKVGRK